MSSASQTPGSVVSSSVEPLCPQQVPLAIVPFRVTILAATQATTFVPNTSPPLIDAPVIFVWVGSGDIFGGLDAL